MIWLYNNCEFLLKIRSCCDDDVFSMIELLSLMKNWTGIVECYNDDHRQETASNIFRKKVDSWSSSSWNWNRYMNDFIFLQVMIVSLSSASHLHRIVVVKSMIIWWQFFLLIIKFDQNLLIASKNLFWNYYWQGIIDNSLNSFSKFSLSNFQTSSKLKIIFLLPLLLLALAIFLSSKKQCALNNDFLTNFFADNLLVTPNIV